MAKDRSSLWLGCWMWLARLAADIRLVACECCWCVHNWICCGVLDDEGEEMKWIIAVVRTICMITTAMVWVIINIVAYHYVISTTELSTFTGAVLSVAFPISASSGAGYLIYRWLKGLRSTWPL